MVRGTRRGRLGSCPGLAAPGGCSLRATSWCSPRRCCCRTRHGRAISDSSVRSCLLLMLTAHCTAQQHRIPARHLLVLGRML